MPKLDWNHLRLLVLVASGTLYTPSGNSIVG